MKTIAGHSESKHDALPHDLIPHAGTVMKNSWVRPNKRIFDNTKVSDHFAIIPTGVIPPKELPEAEQKIFDMVTRHDRIRVNALDRHGQPFELAADGLLSVCIQHEIDHLDGKLFVDYLSRLKRDRVKSKLEKDRARRA